MMMMRFRYIYETDNSIYHSFNKTFISIYYYYYYYYYLTTITGSAVALHCGKPRPTCKVNEKGRTLTPVTSKSLKIVRFELDVHDHVHDIYTSENFHFNPFSGGFSPDRWNITGLWLFPGYNEFFSRAGAQVEPVDGFSPFMAHTTWFHPRTVLLGFRLYRNSFRGNIPQNTAKMAWIGNFKPNRTNIKFAISCKV